MLKQWRSRLDLTSLQMQLTVGVATVSALGVGAIALGLGIHLDRIVVSAHKQQVENVAQRFGETVEIYSDMTTPNMALQKAVNHLSTGDTLIWVEQDGEVVAQSESLAMGSYRDALLMASQEGLAAAPTVYIVGQGYWVMCGTRLTVNQADWGQLNIAHDITGAQSMLYRLLWTLGGVSAIALGGMSVALAFYIRRALRPLKTLCDLTDSISAEQLGESLIHIDRAPSELQKLEKAFNQMLQRFHGAWESQQQFVSNVSHELRTPLTIVSGYLQSTLRRGQNLSEAQKEALGVASSEAERTIQLLEDLLELTRADGGQLHFRLQTLLLNDFLQDVVEMAQHYCQRDIFLHLPNQLIEVQVDPDRLKQILLNLIDNAVKYSEAGQPVKLALHHHAHTVQIQVCDQGDGIPLAQQTRIFERFYRLDDSRSRSTGGTGLGLAIVKTLVEGMGGQITVRSTPGEGSTFVVTLPARTGALP